MILNVELKVYFLSLEQACTSEEWFHLKLYSVHMMFLQGFWFGGFFWMEYFLFFFFHFLLLFNYSCLHFPPTTPPHNSQPSPLPTLNPTLLWFCPWVLYTCSRKLFPLFLPFSPPPPPLWLLSVCSQFQRLWLYFACLLVLLISFHLQVRLHGICLSPLGLFHLA